MFICGQGTSSDEIELIEEVLPSKRKRLSYGRGCAHVLQVSLSVSVSVGAADINRVTNS